MNQYDHYNAAMNLLANLCDYTHEAELAKTILRFKNKDPYEYIMCFNGVSHPAWKILIVETLLMNDLRTLAVGE